MIRGGPFDDECVREDPRVEGPDARQRLVSSITASRVSLPRRRRGRRRRWSRASGVDRRGGCCTPTRPRLGRELLDALGHGASRQVCDRGRAVLPNSSALITEITTLPASAPAIGGMVDSTPSHGIETIAISAASAAATFSIGTKLPSGSVSPQGSAADLPLLAARPDDDVWPAAAKLMARPRPSHRCQPKMAIFNVQTPSVVSPTRRLAAWRCVGKEKRDGHGSRRRPAPG